MNAIASEQRERKIILALLMIVCFLMTWLAVYDEERQERVQRYSNAVSFVFSKDQTFLRKRADLDLNRSPPTSPSPPAEVRTGSQIPPSFNPSERKRKNDQGSHPSTEKTAPLNKLQRHRLSTQKAMRKFRSKWNNAGNEKAKKTLDPEEYAKYKQTFDHYKKQELTRSKATYDKQKKLVNEKDPIAMERQEKRLKRYREYYHKVTKVKRKKGSKDAPAVEEGQDKSNHFSKRASPETRLQIGDPTPDPAPADVPIENEEERKLELRRKRSRDYNAQFTKKAEEQARKTLSTEDFEKYQERCKHYREKRVSYAKAGNKRLKDAELAGDQRATQRHDRILETKRQRYKRKKFGDFLSTGLSSKKDRKHGNRKFGDDETLRSLLEQPLDPSSRAVLARHLKRRERGRMDFKKNILRAREGDAKGQEWHERRKKYNKGYMQRYRAEKKKADSSNDNPPSSTG